MNHLSFRTSTVNLDPGSWTALGGGGGALADGGPPSSSSSSFQTQELSLLMPGNVSWWPRHHDWDAWLQRNVAETTREFDTKLDVTPETNDTSTSEVASRPSYSSMILDVNYSLCVHGFCMCAFCSCSLFLRPCWLETYSNPLLVKLEKFCIIILNSSLLLKNQLC